MRNIIFSLFIIGGSISCRAQIGTESNEEIKNSNNLNKVSTNVNMAPANNASSTISADSITIQYESKKESKGKVSKTRSKESYSSKVIQLNSSFSQTKKTASRQSHQRTPSIEQQDKLDKCSQEMLKLDPEGVESNLNYYSAGNYDIQRELNLKKAQELEPNNPEVLKFVSAHAIIKNNQEDATNSLTQLNELNILSNESISYAEDVVQSACGNSTLITHGFNDTYGVNYVLLKKKTQCSNDLTVVSLDFLQSDYYRKRLSNEGYAVPSKKTVDVAYLKEFCQLNSHKKIAISMTLPKPYLVEIASNLYPVGLVFDYGNTPRKNYQELSNLWEKKLNKKVIKKFQSPISNDLSANYLPMLIYLNQYYKAQNNTEKSIQIIQEIDRIKQKAKLNKKK